MISYWTLSAFLLCFQVAADDPAAKESQVTQQDIQQAIEALDNASFQVREKAAKDLWGFGKQAKPALLEVAQNGSLEASGRARRILAYIDAGITPDTPESQSSILRQFHLSTQAERGAKVFALLKQGDLELIAKLIDRIDDPVVEQGLFRQSFMNSAIMTKLIESRKLDWWIQKANEQDASIRRHDVIVTWLTHRDTLRELRDKDNLSIIETLFAQEPHDPSRFALAKSLIARSAFVEMFAKEANINVFLRVIDLPTDPGARHDLLLALINMADTASIIQTGVVRKIMRFAQGKLPAASIKEIKLAYLNLISSPRDLKKQLSVGTFTELCSDITPAELDRWFNQAVRQPIFVLWMLETDHFRPLLEWSTNLPKSSRDNFIAHLTVLVAERQGFWERLLGDPATLEVHWQLIDAMSDEEKKHNLLLSLAPILASESHLQSEPRKQLTRLIMSAHTPAADAALTSMLRQPLYRERVYDQGEDVKAHLYRFAQFDHTITGSLLLEAYQSIFSANSLRGYFAEAGNSQWLLTEYLPSLSSPNRQVAVKAMCGSDRIVQTWQGKPFFEQLLVLASEQTDSNDRLACIASILRHDQLAVLAKNDAKIPLLNMYRDESLPEAGRAIFIKAVATNRYYLDWLIQNGQANDFIDVVEGLGTQPGLEMRSLYSSMPYMMFLAKQDRLESWITILEENPVAESRVFLMLLQHPDLLTPEFIERHFDRSVRLAESIGDPLQRGQLLAAILFSPSSLAVHIRKQEVDLLLQRIGSQHHPVVQGTLLRSLSHTDVMKAFAGSGNLNAVVEMIRGLPLERGPAALSSISNPILLDHLVDTEQVDLLFEMLLRAPSGSSSMLNNTMVVQLLIKHGYVDRLLEGVETFKDREILTARIVSSSTAVAYYAKKGRLRDLVKLLEQLEPGRTRDTALNSLFQQPELVLSLCKEIGVEKSAALVDTIDNSFFLAQSRANFVITLCTLKKVSEHRLRQLLVDIENSGMVSAPRRQSIVEGAVGEQVIAAGLLPQVKQTFLKISHSSRARNSKPLDDFYSSALVLKHLIQSGRIDEFMEHVRSIPDPLDVIAIANQLVATDQGCQILLSSEGFPVFAAIIETMSAYYQGHYWSLFWSNPKVIHYVSHSEDIDALLRYLTTRNGKINEIEAFVVRIAQDERLDQIVGNRVLMSQLVDSIPRLSATTQANFASQLSRHPNAIWRMVETGQWDSFVAIMECEPSAESRERRWRTCTHPHSGLISALIATDQGDKAIDILHKCADSAVERDSIDQWIRVSTGTLGEDVEALEANAEKLKQDEWRRLASAYRAQGSDSHAVKAAIKANDHNFLTALAIERGDWAEAASLLTQSPAPQPHIHPKEDEALRLEHQGMLLVTRLYAQQHDQLQPPIDALLDLRSETKNMRVRSRCCDALLLGEQFESALSFIDQFFIHRALRLRLHQRKLPSAIRVSEWNPHDPQGFLATMHASVGNDLGAMRATVDLLSALSHAQRHEEMHVLHDAMIESLLKKSAGVSDGQRLMGYATQLYRHELYDLFWLTLEQMDVATLVRSGFLAAHAQDAVDRTARLFLPRVAYGQQSSRATPHDVRSAIAAIRTADDAVRLNSVRKDRLDQWVDDLSSTSGAWNDEKALAVGIICLRQGRLEDATRILISLEPTYAVASEALARDAWQRKDWDKAAVHYDRLNLKSRDRVEAMYLSGLALSRSGQADAGEAKMAKSLGVAYHPVLQLRLGIELLRLDEPELGNRVLRTVVRLAPHHSGTQLDAIAQLVANASSPEEVHRWSQQWQILQARYVYGNGEQAEFLRVPMMLHNALAEQAFSDKDWQRVDAELEKCRAANDGDSDFYTQWISRLCQAGQTDLAKTWEQKIDARPAPPH
jgi:hypothetical protein